jgi:hypothetical protein
MGYQELQQQKRAMQQLITQVEAKLADDHTRLTYQTVDDEEGRFLTITFNPIVGTLSVKEKFLIKAIMIEHGTRKIIAPESVAGYPYRDFMLAAFSKQPYTYEYRGTSSQAGEITKKALALFKKYMAAYPFEEAYTGAVNRYQSNFHDSDLPPAVWFREQFSGGGGWATSR